MGVILPHGCRPGTAESTVGNGRPVGVTGGNIIISLTDALARLPGASTFIIGYTRASSHGQAGPGRVLLAERADDLAEEIEQLAPGKLVTVVTGIEKGTVSTPRPTLREVAALAARLPGGPHILCAPYRTRLLRAARDRAAWPTAQEFALLRQATAPAVLAITYDPGLPECALRAIAIKRSRRAGRPRRLSPALAAAVFGALNRLFLVPGLGWRWSHRLSQVAAAFGLSRATIHRESFRLSPSGRSWRRGAG
jgi:hypothetical protein